MLDIFVLFDYESDHKDVNPGSLLQQYDSSVSLETLLAEGRKHEYLGIKLTGFRVNLEQKNG